MWSFVVSCEPTTGISWSSNLILLITKDWFNPGEPSWLTSPDVQHAAAGVGSLFTVRNVCSLGFWSLEIFFIQ